MSVEFESEEMTMKLIEGQKVINSKSYIEMYQDYIDEYCTPDIYRKAKVKPSDESQVKDKDESFNSFLKALM